MQAIRRINNNAAICVDGHGHELVALGRGVGFGELPHDVSLKAITRTFYGIDEKYLSLLRELDPRVLEFSAQLVDIARSQVSHGLSPNLPVTLADHISFAIKRVEEHMMVQMPLAYDVQQQYPVEFGLGEMAVRGVAKTFGIRLPPSEAVGIALCIVNAAVTSSDLSQRSGLRKEHLTDKAVAAIEDEAKIKVDRGSFDFARFATHLSYLTDRVATGKPLNTELSGLYPTVLEQYPLAMRCAEKIAQLVGDAYGSKVTQEECVYLALHAQRLIDRAGSRLQSV